MPPKSKKRASKADDYDSDGGFVEDAPQSKRAKTAISKDKQVDDDGNPYWELSGKRRVTLSEYKKIHLINIREYYEKDGKTLPGKKGISLSLEQFSAFLGILPEVEEALKSQGQELPRPNYTQDEIPADYEPETDAAATTTSKLDRFKYEKKNHEATSDEED
ncbi:PC4-domain-containing protein [Aureobasidium namibiae CBS 147.97]|uniref:PC4-domain-containing protein n=1 Tax=Aureobasidium namibiae CBS 147.97 TaxID=1043004 RepID=A0A074WFX8_9PEZI|nr:PC4-domain-containing protein [Aureobasidium namibiae CBS 147.97]KEQ71990.1 PC4-domain-containing protein [Aureobasidium namibiae CBS 147.97]